MTSSRVLPVLLMALATLSATACQQPDAPVAPTYPVVDRTTPDPAPSPIDRAPLDGEKATARLAIEVAAAIGPAIRAYGPLVDAIRASRVKHPPATARRLQAVDGWRFLGGWWLGSAPNGAQLKATVESAAGENPGWDVTREEAYGADLQPSFPADVVRLRLDADQTLPGGAGLTFTLIAPLGVHGQALEASGTGAIAPPATTPATGFKALNARIGPDGTLERGDLTLEARVDANTLLITGTYGPGGLASGAQLSFSGRPLGQLTAEGAGWSLKNAAGSFPL